MKKILIIVPILLVCVLAYAGTGRKYETVNYYDTIVYTASYAGAQTQLEAVVGGLAVLTGGTSYFIDKIIWTAGTAASMYISDVAANSTPDYGPVYSGTSSSFLDNDVNLKLGAACSIYVTASGTGDITIFYHLE